MTTNSYVQHRSVSFAQQLTANVRDVMRVAGPPDAEGNPRPLRTVDLQKRTGIARSTLRALKNPSCPDGPNPDLHTLSRLAAALGIPLGFLLLRAEDWHLLRQAFGDAPMPMEAAEKLIPNNNLPVPAGTPERVLRECAMHPVPVPYGYGADPAEVGRVALRNEQRRRASHVLGTLMLRGSPDRDTKVLLTALAATLANLLSYGTQAQPGH